MAKSPSAKPAPKSEILAGLAEHSGLSKKEVTAVLNGLSELVKSQLGKKGPGVFIIPGLIKLRVVRKPATKAKKGINPFTKQEIIIKAKPARNVVKATPVKALKDMVS